MRKSTPTQIRNSNSYSLAVQIQQTGGEPVLLPIAPDDPRRLRQLIEQGLQSDLLLMTGGVSMGRYDLVEQVLAELRAEFFFTGAKIQPGRPVVFGRVSCGAGILTRAKGLQPQSRTSISSAFPAIRSRPWSPSNFSPPHARSAGRNVTSSARISARSSQSRNPR
jgi:hypothetical protein